MHFSATSQKTHVTAVSLGVFGQNCVVFAPEVVRPVFSPGDRPMDRTLDFWHGSPVGGFPGPMGPEGPPGGPGALFARFCPVFARFHPFSHVPDPLSPGLAVFARFLTVVAVFGLFPHVFHRFHTS